MGSATDTILTDSGISSQAYKLAVGTSKLTMYEQYKLLVEVQRKVEVIPEATLRVIAQRIPRCARHPDGDLALGELKRLLSLSKEELIYSAIRAKPEEKIDWPTLPEDSIYEELPAGSEASPTGRYH